eukprot:Skav232884  [mRNA]  locus=scaffold1432:235686:236675:- [translate_table: standard]
MEAASFGNKELVPGASARKRKIDEEPDADSNGDPWLQVRHYLTKMMERANLGTARQEKMFLANVKEQIERLMKQEKADAIQHAAGEPSAQPRDPKLTSKVPGVAWHKDLQKWRVQIYQKGKKSIYGGLFTEKAAAEAKCLELRQHSQERKVTTTLEDRVPKARHAAKGKDAVFAFARDSAAPSAQKPSQSKRENLVKQSRVKHVYWSRTLDAWRVVFPRLDSKGKQIGLTGRVFAVKKFLVPGRSEAEADAEALQAAKAFLAELVQQGVLKQRDPKFTSEVPGVKWDKGKQKWRVQIYQKGKKSVWGGRFTEKAAAEAKCLELRKDLCR